MNVYMQISIFQSRKQQNIKFKHVKLFTTEGLEGQGSVLVVLNILGREQGVSREVFAKNEIIGRCS